MRQQSRQYARRRHILAAPRHDLQRDNSLRAEGEFLLDATTQRQQFAGHHEIGLHGRRGDALVYDSYKMNSGAHCVLTLRANRERLVFFDRDDICRTELCGARGVSAR